CLMVAPGFGARFVPARLRIVLAIALTLLVAPSLKAPSGIVVLSINGAVITLQQILIGVAAGFALQTVFDSLAMGGQLLANSMGLSFAFNVDPQHGASTPVVGQLYMLLVMLTFLALNGHIALLQALTHSFVTLPINVDGLSAANVWSIVSFGRFLFEGALAVALPGMTALLIVNLGFGVMSRAAPALNMFAVGFPITLVFGVVIVLLGLPAVQSSFISLLENALDFVGVLFRN
ncbi:MAG TPA: flagellar biosynthetic protein FliR, partial [Steroidobacteraceae bacterium]|nr:flagellar biosynthetic protein FliR [Steroidobacteraceae bacterium]